MNDKELYDLFHAYRPELDDDDALLARLAKQMDATDEQQHPRVLPLYRRMIPWTAGIAAAVVIAVIMVNLLLPDSPHTHPYREGADCFVGNELSESKVIAPSLTGKVGGEFKSSSFNPFASFDEAVAEIERSGRELQLAIAEMKKGESL